jgi:hypothetical protein
MNHPTIIVENKKFVLLPNEEYLDLLQDIADLKKVFARKNKSSMEANSFFNVLKRKLIKK